MTEVIKIIENSGLYFININAISSINYPIKLLQLILETNSDDEYEVIKSYSWEETQKLPSIDPIKLYKEKTLKNGGNEYKKSKNFEDFK